MEIITRRQGAFYLEEYGWNYEFEKLCEEIVQGFESSFDPEKEYCWVAERNGEIIGSIFLVRQSDDVAKLRLLFVESSARGLGLGRRLVDECIQFARKKGYKILTLWTNSVLTTARKLYESVGFKLVQEEAHHSFGKDLVGQNWDLDLTN